MPPVVVSQVAGRLKHGWFRDGVTHPNSDLPPDGLPRMTWEEKVMPFASGNVYSYTPTQVSPVARFALAGRVAQRYGWGRTI